jgi:hypothetical protein
MVYGKTENFAVHTKASDLRYCERQRLRHIANENHLMKRVIAERRLYHSYLCFCDSSVKLLLFKKKSKCTQSTSLTILILISLPEILLDLLYHVSISVSILRSGTLSLSILLHWIGIFLSKRAFLHLLSEWSYYFIDF